MHSSNVDAFKTWSRVRPVGPVSPSWVRAAVELDRTLGLMKFTGAEITADRLLDAVLRVLDRSRFTPQGWASRRIDRFLDERQRKAALDTRWQEIQQRRGPKGLILLSDDLSWSDCEEQRRIAENLLPDPWWMPVLRRVSNLSLVDARRDARFRRQRARRGWSDADVWSLDNHLCRTLAGQLEQLADNANVWPGEGTQWVDEHAWQADLRRNAALLRRYADSVGVDDVTSDWYRLAHRRGTDPVEVEAASATIVALEKEQLDGARAALHWVADNLQYLWD